MDSVTLPFPLALMATRASGPAGLFYWSDGSDTLFKICYTNWTWTAKAQPGTYPNWKQIVPEQDSLKYSVSLTAERAEQLKSWLKNLPDDPPNNGIELRRNNDALILNNFKGLKVGAAAYFEGEWNEHTLVVNRDLLMRLLSEGHTQIQFSDQHAPFMASGGNGMYIAMPLFKPETPKVPEKQCSI